MSHNHSHIKSNETSEVKLLITIALDFLITVVQIIGGILSGSLSLISDAMHNFSDAVSIIITFIALRLSKRPKTPKYTFGLKRAEIIAAVINASTLIIICFFLIKEAVEKLNNPNEITVSLMLLVAFIGLIPNVAGAFAENITTEFLELPNLEVGTKIKIGKEAELELTQIGKECHSKCAIFFKVGDCVMPREGIFAKVIRGGEIFIGDEIKILSTPPC